MGTDVQVETDTGEETLKLSVIAFYIKNNLWWGQTFVLGKVHDLVAQLQWWADSCPCHRWLHKEQNTGVTEVTELTDLMRAAEPPLVHDGPNFNCTMQGSFGPQP